MGMGVHDLFIEETAPFVVVYLFAAPAAIHRFRPYPPIPPYPPVLLYTPVSPLSACSAACKGKKTSGCCRYAEVLRRLFILEM